MRRYGLGWIALGAFLFQGTFAVAQDSLRALEQELDEAKQQHQEITAQALANFFGQIDAAAASPEAAVNLYQQAGGTMPDPTPVVTQHEEESASEKDARIAKDQANLAKLGAALQLHCGLMHYAAMFIVKPDQKGLQEEWTAWLQKAAPLYPQLAIPAAGSNPPPNPNPNPNKKKRDGEAGGAHPQPYSPLDVKTKTMRDSAISKFLGFKNWGEKDQGKEQGNWAVKDLPKLYRATVLEPLRATPTAATLAAWDAYIAMANADEPDNDKWNQIVYPPLQFDRACDAYTISPDTEKLQGLVNLIKANPTYPQVDSWISRVHQMLEDYNSHHGGKAPVAQNPEPTTTAVTDPNVTVTTTHQGDATIITTHTNAAPVPNAPLGH